MLVLELTSTRLLAYVGSSHATSAALAIALLGLGVGAYLRLRIPRLDELAAIGLAGSLLLLGAAAIVGVSLPGLVALSLPPFATAGALISSAYAARGSARARSTYAIDLAAAAIGCTVAPRLLGPLAPTEIVLVLGLASCALARRRIALALALIHVGLLVCGRAGVLPDGPLEALLRSQLPEKSLLEARREIVDSAWSPLGRLDVQRTSSERLGVFTDGMSPTYLVRNAEFEQSWGLLMSLPYRALRPERVLVLGAGAGASVRLAKKYGASRVDAVEVNPAIPEVLARWRASGGDVYAAPGVRLVIEDARRHLADTDERYDLIELALALTGNVHAQPAGMEATLYTVEAVELYLQRLTPTGSLVLIHSDPGNAYRQLLTVLAALEARGLDRAAALAGIVVLHDPRPGTAYRFMIVARTSPLPLDVADALDLPPAELLWAPGDPPERSAQLLDPAKLGLTAADDFSPVHDTRPYFFQNTQGLVATALADPSRLWVLAGALLIVAMLIVERRRSEQFEPTATPLFRPAVVACTLGAAFLSVELAMIQRLTLAAGGTLYAVSFVLFGLLAWSAVGALVIGPRLRGVGWACAIAAVAVGVTAPVVHDLAWLEAIASEPARVLLIALLLAPTGLAIGCPFPLLLGREPASRIASLWALNGAAAVAGGIVATLALRVAGSTWALLLAAALYGVAAVLARRSSASR